MRIAFPTAPEGVEEIELTEPWKAVEQAGWNPQLVSTGPGRVRAYHHLDKAGSFPVDHILAGDTSDAFVPPRGLANPDALRLDEPLRVCEAAPSTLVTSRKPDDLDAFCAAIVEQFGT